MALLQRHPSIPSRDPGDSKAPPSGAEARGGGRGQGPKAEAGCATVLGRGRGPRAPRGEGLRDAAPGWGRVHPEGRGTRVSTSRPTRAASGGVTSPPAGGVEWRGRRK